jgi:hypothetical protein
MFGSLPNRAAVCHTFDAAVLSSIWFIARVKMLSHFANVMQCIFDAKPRQNSGE